MSDADTPHPTAGDASPLNVVGSPSASDEEGADDVEETGLGPGVRVERYVIAREIGSGGMGTVYAAYDPDLDRRVALKVVHAEGDEEVSVEASRIRLLREAKACGSLAHPNVVKVYGVGVHEERVFIAMEYVEGLSLREWLREKDRSWRDVLKVFKAAGRGLAAAHAAGFVHRDFKPDNVLIRADGRVKVVDFGLARSHGEHDPRPDESAERARRVVRRQGRRRQTENLTRTGATVGTPAYMSPEQHRAEPADPRSDQFAFCVSMWEALYGARPFDRRSYVEVARAKARGEIEDPPRALRSRVPDWLHEALRTGMAPLPDQRHGSMEELLELFERHAEGRQRRRALLPLSVVLVALLGVAVWQGMVADPGPCAGGSTRIRSVWDKPQRRALSRRFDGDAGAVVAALDEYAAGWVEVEQSVCRQVRIDRRRDEEWLDGRSIFLERRLEAMSGLVARLDEEGLGEERALSAIAALPPASGCLETAEGSGGAPMPGDPELARNVRRERELLQQARHDATVGRAGPALGQVRSVLERARALDDSPLEADALVLLARISVETGSDPADLRPLLHEAAQAAMMAGYDERVLEAWVELAMGLVGDDPGRARQWLAYAEELASRVGSTPRRNVDLAIVRARLALADGEVREALRSANGALALAEKEWGPTHPRVVRPLVAVGGALERDGRQEEAHALNDRAMAILVEAGAQDTIAATPVFLQLASNDRIEEPEEALTHVEKALALLDNGVVPTHPWLPEAHLLHARILGDLDRWEEADAEAAVALDLVRARLGEGDLRLLPYLRFAARGAQETGRHDAARSLSGLAVELLEDGDDVVLLGEVRLQHARHLAAVGETEAGLALARRVATTCGEACRLDAQTLIDELEN